MGGGGSGESLATNSFPWKIAGAVDGGGGGGGLVWVQLVLQYNRRMKLVDEIERLRIWKFDLGGMSSPQLAFLGSPHQCHIAPFTNH